MPTVSGTDLFSHGDFTVPGGGPYHGMVGSLPTDDHSQVPYGEIAVAKWTLTGYLRYAHGSPPSRGWAGFFFRMNTGEEPAGNQTILQYWTLGFGQASKIYWIPATNEFAFTVGDITYNNVAIALDTYHWIELIFDASGTTHTLYYRIDGGTAASVSDSGGGAGTTVQYLELGSLFADFTSRFGHVMWGSAASTSDWLGQPPVIRTRSPQLDFDFAR